MSTYNMNNNEKAAQKRRKPGVVNINALQMGLDFNNQSALDPDEEGVHVCKFCDNNVDPPACFEGVKTFYDIFQRGVRIAGENQCLGWKPDPSSPLKWMTYNEANARASSFGSGLLALGLKPCNETRVGIYSQNRPEYVIADQAFVRHSICSVPLYDTLGADAGSYIINQAELSIVVCDTVEKVNKILNKRQDTPDVNTLIVFDVVDEDLKAKAKEEGIDIYTMSEVEELGDKHPSDPHPPDQDDLYIICYTSGTTGDPKGAMISHRNMSSNMNGLQFLLNHEQFGIHMRSDDRTISYLPMAHAYERINQTNLFVNGGSIGFFQGDIRKLLDDIKEIQPTVFPCVPRLLNRMHDKILSGVNASRIKKMLFTKAMNSKKKDLQRGIIRNDTLWDRIVFKKIHQMLGGHVRIITTGSAPLSAEVLTFLKCVVGCPILEGYGQTENGAAATVTLLGDSEAGHVGPPIPGFKIKVVDVPDMNYFSKDGKGEVCLKSHCVFRGYLKNEEKTKEALDSDGWLHTGDIGEWLPNGALKIVDRKKHIFKLAQGEYIAPEKIENVLVQSEYIAQVFVDGDSLESFLVAVVVPDPETLPHLASKLGVTGSLTDLMSDPIVRHAIMEDMAAVGTKNKLSSLEKVKEIHIHPELFSVENDLLTPTFKSKRPQLKARFSQEVVDMYKRAKDALNEKQ